MATPTLSYPRYSRRFKPSVICLTASPSRIKQPNIPHKSNHTVTYDYPLRVIKYNDYRGRTGKPFNRPGAVICANPGGTGLRYVALTSGRNEEKYVERAVRGVLSQSLPPDAYVVAGGGREGGGGGEGG